MGKYMRKCKGIEEIAVMEVAHVGVRTRARALAMAMESSGTLKRRNVGGGRELKFSPSLVPLRTRRRVTEANENSVSAPATSVNPGRRSVVGERCSSPSSDHVEASCCSSNGSSELSKEDSKFVDLEEESVEIETSAYNFDCRERRETTPSSELQAEYGELESTAKPSEAHSCRRSAAVKMPSESELEEFFAEAEKDIQKRFTKKYNFDIVNEVPMKGRYEWVEVQQKH